MDFKNSFPANSSALSSRFARGWRGWTAAFVLALAVVVGYRLTLAPPANFPSGSVVSVARGATAPEVAAQFANAHIIAHPLLLRGLLRVSGTSARIRAGAYLFKSPENLLTVAYRLVAGSYGLPPVRITFPEGETVREAAERVREAFPEISSSDFIAAAKPYEGYLFPDTYLFFASADTETIIKAMRDNFNAKMTSRAGDIAASGHSLSDIVILASLVEREARTVANKRIVADILWRRLDLGMPLQVDAVFGYIFGRDTYSPSLSDLKADSPYNTYTHKGLPPGPINNPGLESIDAALNPTKTNYLYYLTGSDNQMHYAATYAGHQANRRKYLR